MLKGQQELLAGSSIHGSSFEGYPNTVLSPAGFNRPVTLDTADLL